MITDTKSLEEIAQQLLEAAARIREDADADAGALQIELDQSETNEQVTEQTSADAGAAAGGAIDEADYQVVFSNLDTTPTSSKPLFDRIFDDVKEAFLAEVSQDINIALRGAVNKAIVAAEDFDALVDVIIVESAKIQVASAAGLLTPPSKVEVRELRDQTQVMSDETQNTVNDLRSAAARRRTARRRLGQDPRVPREEPRSPILGPVDDRDVEEMAGPTGTSGVAEPGTVDLNLATSTSGADDLQAQAQRTGVSGANLSAAAGAVSGTVLDRVEYMALCLALAQLGTSQATEARARRVMNTLIFLVDRVKFILSSQFANDLQQGMQEITADTIAGIGTSIQAKLDAFDAWLALTVPPLPTFVSTVDALGDRSPDTIFFQELAGRCALQFQSFCDFQGLLEVAKSLDAELGLVQPRAPRLGKACLLLDAPDPGQGEVEALVARPDSQANLLLGAPVAVNDTQVQAYFPRADVTRDLTTPLPQLTGVIDELVLADAEEIKLSGFTAVNNINTVANSSLVLEPGTPQEETLRYSTFSVSAGVYTFSMIDRPVVGHAASEPARVDGEYRGTFDGVYEQRSEIGGGPGTMNIGADGETRETLAYDSSAFDPATGLYTFALSAPAPNPHRRNVIGRPLPNEKRVLFKPDLRAPAARFDVSGDTITHVSDPGFDFASEIDAGDFSGGGPFRLVIGNPETPIGVQVASVAPGTLTLTEPFHDGAQTSVPLSRVDRLNAAGTTFKARLRSRQVDDLRLDPGLFTSQPVTGQVVLDAGIGTRHITRPDGVVTDVGSGVQRVSSAARVFRPGDAGSAFQIQGGQQYLNTSIDAVIDDQTIEFTGRLMTGTLEISAVTQGSPAGSEVYGTSTLFTSEVMQNDWINFGGTNTFKVRAVIDDTTMVLATDESAGAASGLTGHVVAGPEALAGRALSFTRSPQETREVVSATQDADGSLWNFELATPSAFEHGTQELEIAPSIQIIPGSLADFPTTPTTTEPRFDPGILPPGSTTLRATFEDLVQAPVLGPLIGLAGGNMEVTGLGTVAYSSAVQDSPPDYDTLTFTLVEPTARPLAAGVLVKVDTTTVASQIAASFPGGWELPFTDFLVELGELLATLEQKLCRLLEGRPVDVGLTAAAVNAGAQLIKAQILTLKIVLQGLLPGLPESQQIQSLAAKLDAAGMERAKEAVESGDVATMSAMSAGESTFQGELLTRTVAYREGLTEVGKASKADRIAAQLKGEETSTRLLAETRLGFQAAASEELTRRKEAAANLEADAQEITS